MKLPANTLVYHATKFVHILSILQKGIKEVESEWGDTELGKGFYTATTKEGAAAYLTEGGGIIEFKTEKEMEGYKVTPPPGFAWKESNRQEEIDEWCVEYDFLVNAVDEPVSQYKFNFGKGTEKLKALSVYMKKDDGTYDKKSAEAYIKMCIDGEDS